MSNLDQAAAARLEQALRQRCEAFGQKPEPAESAGDPSPVVVAAVCGLLLPLRAFLRPLRGPGGRAA